MAAEDFFRRWAKRKADAATDNAIPATPAYATPQADSGLPEKNTFHTSAAKPAAKPAAMPTLDDVAQLTRDSDYSPFVARGVDDAVKRSAMKKLFSDPRFNVMDGLDTYIGDYHTFEPIPPAMLAALNHAKTLLDPLSVFEKPASPLSPIIDGTVDADRVLAESAAQDACDAGTGAVMPKEFDLAPSSTIPQTTPQQADVSIADADKDTESTQRPGAFPVPDKVLDNNRLDPE